MVVKRRALFLSVKAYRASPLKFRSDDETCCVGASSAWGMT